MAVHDVFLFEGLKLDVKRGSLESAGRSIELRPESFDVLRYLIENADRLVSKGEIMQAVWRNVAVTDKSLTRCISDIRLALGDDAQRIIKTVPRRGYLFAASVSKAHNDRHGHQSVNAGLGLAPPLPDRPSIAVLPFVNMSGDPLQDYFSDGLWEDLTTSLSKFASLFVIARNSAFQYKNINVNAKRIGHEVGVRYVLEGSVRRDADHVRITAQLIDTGTGAHHGRSSTTVNSAVSLRCRTR